MKKGNYKLPKFNYNKIADKYYLTEYNSLTKDDDFVINNFILRKLFNDDYTLNLQKIFELNNNNFYTNILSNLGTTLILHGVKCIDENGEFYYSIYNKENQDKVKNKGLREESIIYNTLYVNDFRLYKAAGIYKPYKDEEGYEYDYIIKGVNIVDNSNMTSYNYIPVLIGCMSEFIDDRFNTEK